MQITTIGLDIAKNVFQVHGIDAAEKVVVRKQLRRKQLIPFFESLAPCLVGMEACATSHHWARELTRLAIRYGSGLIGRAWAIVFAGGGCRVVLVALDAGLHVLRRTLAMRLSLTATAVSFGAASFSRKVARR
jgi:hypothetical protein